MTAGSAAAHLGTGVDPAARLEVPKGPWSADRYEVVQSASWMRKRHPDVPCMVAGCKESSLVLSSRSAQFPAGTGLCKGHSTRWTRSGRIALGEFLLSQRDRPLRLKTPVNLTISPDHAAVELGGLRLRVAEEVRFAIATSINSRQWTATAELAFHLRCIVGMLTSSQVDSILDESVERWIIRLGTHCRDVIDLSDSRSRGVCGRFRSLYEVLVDGCTVDPWLRDEWKADLCNVAAALHRKSIHWEKVTVPWLRDGLKQYARISLSTKKAGWSTVNDWCKAAGKFSTFLDGRRGPPIEPSQISRQLIIEYFGTLSSDNARSRARVLVDLFYRMRENEILPELPDVLLLLRGEAVARKTRSPRPYPPDVIQRIDSEVLNSTLLTETERRIVKLLRFGGPRPSEALRLPIDSLRVTADGKYWIEYYQTKVDEYRRFPIISSLGLELVEQQESVRRKYGSGAAHMFPSERRSIPEVDGVGGTTVPFSYSGFHKRVRRVFALLGIDRSDTTGELITGGELHRFRHTLATEMINDGWSLYEVQKFLGHVSSTMTQAYAELHDETLDRLYRELMESAVDGEGKPILDGVHFDTGVERMREKLAKAALPNGFCDLPENKPCDFRPNPCLACSFFRTTPVFLDTHRRHRDELKVLVDDGKRQGYERIVEINKPMLTRVEQLIATLEEAEAATASGNELTEGDQGLALLAKEADRKIS